MQTTLELLDGGRLEFSVLDQIRDCLQERREFSPVVVIKAERSELEAVGTEYDRNCEEAVIVGVPLWWEVGKCGRTSDFYVLSNLRDAFD